MKYYLGADGGGTKTTLSVSDENGRVIYTSLGGSVNYYSEGLDRARKNLADALGDISENTGISRFYSVFIGMSALNERASEDELRSFSEGLTDAELVNMDSDLYIALAATLKKGVCAAAIAGTGSMLAARKQDGEILTRGGCGYILGDEGSAYRIAIDGIRLAVRAYEKAAQETLLTDAVFRFFGAGNKRQLIDAVYSGGIDRKALARFAREVTLCAEKGDVSAREILKNQAELFSYTALSLLRELPKGTELAVYGGVFEHDKIFTSYFEKEINAHGSSIYALPVPPVYGALLCAYREAGGKNEEAFTAGLKNNIKR